MPQAATQSARCSSLHSPLHYVPQGSLGFMESHAYACPPKRIGSLRSHYYHNATLRSAISKKVACFASSRGSAPRRLAPPPRTKRTQADDSKQPTPAHPLRRAHKPRHPTVATPPPSTRRAGSICQSCAPRGRIGTSSAQDKITLMGQSVRG